MSEKEEVEKEMEGMARRVKEGMEGKEAVTLLLFWLSVRPFCCNNTKLRCCCSCWHWWDCWGAAGRRRKGEAAARRPLLVLLLLLLLAPLRRRSMVLPVASVMGVV
jgi:hypothetical protein